MISAEKLPFLLSALDLTVEDVASAAQVSRQNIYGAIAGQYGLSMRTYDAIESLLRVAFQKRNGQTIPPEVQRIVFEMLWPPPPFDPTEPPKRGPGRPRKTKGDSDGNQGTSETGDSGRAREGAPAASQACGARAEARDPGEHGVLSRVGSGGRDVLFASNEGVRQTVGWDAASLSDASYALKSAERIKGNLPKKFYDDIRAQAPTWLKGSTTDGAIGARLRRMGMQRRRSRSRDEDLTSRKERLASYTLAYIARIESKEHSKGAYQQRSWMDFRAGLLGMIDVPEWKEKAEEILGQQITAAKLDRIFRPLWGGLSPAERAVDRYYQETTGFRPEWSGQVIQIDGSELPVEVLSGWGRARRDGDLAQIFLACTDMGSLRTQIYPEATTSEVHLWDPALQSWLFALGFAPEMVIADEIGRCFHALRNLEIGEPPQLTLGVRLWLAAGVLPHVHRPGRAQAKGAVECGGVKSFKSSLKRVLVAKWLAKELKGCATSSYRKVQTEGEWRAMLAESEQMLNARILQRTGLSREQTWLQDAEGVKQRAARALSPNAAETYRAICSRAHVWQVLGGRQIIARQDGRRAIADLRLPIDDDARECPVVVFPAGLRAGDEQYGGELWRGLVIQNRTGQPKYFAVDVLCAKKSFLGYDLNRPTINEHPVAKAETEHERRRRVWAEAAKATGLKEATNDAPVSGGPATPEDCYRPE